MFVEKNGQCHFLETLKFEINYNFTSNSNSKPSNYTHMVKHIKNSKDLIVLLFQVGQIQILVGAIAVSGKTKWDMLDSIIKRVFKEFVLRVDPITNLGLNADSIRKYSINDIVRVKGGQWRFQ